MPSESPPPTPDAASHPLPTLPAEIQLRIILLSLSPPSFEFFDRSNALVNYALLDRAWRQWAEMELFRSVLVYEKQEFRFSLDGCFLFSCNSLLQSCCWRC